MSTSKLDILVLHALGDMSSARKTSLNHATCLSRYAPTHNYLFHDLNDPVTAALRRMRFHAVVFDTTFLCARYYRPRSLFDEVVDRYSFLAASDAVKLAFPQDEYDHGEVLDGWLSHLKVDVVFSVVWNEWDLLFPRTRKHAEIVRALTGYVDDTDVERMARFSRPFDARRIDVGYRAKNLPPEFGSHGRLKGRLGDEFLSVSRDSGLVLDVSTRSEDVFLGESWLEFLGDCRFTLGSEGGSSLWDPRGEIRDRVLEFLSANPGADFAAVERSCFPGLDRKLVFSAISPRLFEVAIAGSAQILVRAPYLGALRPDEHYIPVGEDLSDLKDVVERVRDTKSAQRMVEATYAALIEPPTYRYRHHAAGIVSKVIEHAERKNLPKSADPRFTVLRAEHEASVAKSRRNQPRLGIVGAVARRMLPERWRRTIRRFLR